MTCYLCGSQSYTFRNGAVRDAPAMKITELAAAFDNAMVSVGKTDTLIAYLECCD